MVVAKRFCVGCGRASDGCQALTLTILWPRLLHQTLHNFILLFFSFVVRGHSELLFHYYTEENVLVDSEKKVEKVELQTSFQWTLGKNKL